MAKKIPVVPVSHRFIFRVEKMIELAEIASVGKPESQVFLGLFSTIIRCQNSPSGVNFLQLTVCHQHIRLYNIVYFNKN